MRERLLTTREASQLLGISEKEIIELANQGKIPAYRVGGEFLRFRQEEILKIKNKFKKASSYSWREKVSDFFYFNDFYIISLILIFLLLWIIFKS